MSLIAKMEYLHSGQSVNPGQRLSLNALGVEEVNPKFKVESQPLMSLKPGLRTLNRAIRALFPCHVNCASVYTMLIDAQFVLEFLKWLAH